MTQTATTHKARPPHPLLTLTEGRALFELGSFYALRRAMRRLPKGDGHAVIVLPGFLAGDTFDRTDARTAERSGLCGLWLGPGAQPALQHRARARALRACSTAFMHNPAGRCR